MINCIVIAQAAKYWLQYEMLLLSLLTIVLPRTWIPILFYFYSGVTEQYNKTLVMRAIVLQSIHFPVYNLTHIRTFYLHFSVKFLFNHFIIFSIRGHYVLREQLLPSPLMLNLLIFRISISSNNFVMGEKCTFIALCRTVSHL